MGACRGRRGLLSAHSIQAWHRPILAATRRRPGVLAWRARMASEDGKASYKPRAICDCFHARWRNWDLRQLTVRGIEKVRAVLLWYALTNNILQGNRLASA